MAKYSQLEDKMDSHELDLPFLSHVIVMFMSHASQDLMYI